MNLSRCCRGFVNGKNTSMDQESVENLSAKQKVAQWIEEVVENLSRRNLEISMDRDFVKIFLDKENERLDKREYVEVLSRIYRRLKHLDRSKKLSRIYRKETQKSRWIEIPLESVKTRRKKDSIEGNLSRSCQVWRKWVFRRRKKHIEMNATSKLLKQRSNQHVKLLKHLTTCMQSIHRSKKKKKKTHTHTLNKSNQFYISKTS